MTNDILEEHHPREENPFDALYILFGELPTTFLALFLCVYGGKGIPEVFPLIFYFGD